MASQRPGRTDHGHAGIDADQPQPGMAQLYHAGNTKARLDELTTGDAAPVKPVGYLADDQRQQDWGKNSTRPVSPRSSTRPVRP